MPSPPHPRLRNRHSLPPAVSNGAHPSDYAARELWTAIPCESLEYRRVAPTSESPTIQELSRSSRINMPISDRSLTMSAFQPNGEVECRAAPKFALDPDLPTHQVNKSL